MAPSARVGRGWPRTVAQLLLIQAQASAVAPSLRLAKIAPEKSAALAVLNKQGGTACECICGSRVVWHRLVFAGNVEKEREWECEHEVCPDIMIPGLRVRAECTYVEDLSELAAGTLCQCQCGDKAAWRNQGFYGNVSEEKERECIEELCPQLNPLPGVRFEADCYFDPHLFSFPAIGNASTAPPMRLRSTAQRRLCLHTTSGVVAVVAVALLGALAVPA